MCIRDRYDGSVHPYEENLAITKKAVELAEKYGANVEAELGSMGKREFGSGKPGEEDDQKIYTDPDMAKEFVEQTGIDALACSFGTTHGIYLTEPKLNFDIVSGVREKTGGVPVVMHGGSGVSKEDFHKAIKAGVRKINYFTYMDKAGGTATEEYVESVEKGKPVFYSCLLYTSLYDRTEERIPCFGRRSGAVHVFPEKIRKRYIWRRRFHHAETERKWYSLCRNRWTCGGV